jgi:hypothetical protein
MLASDDNQHAELLAAVACPTVNPVGKTPSAKILTPKVLNRRDARSADPCRARKRGAKLETQRAAIADRGSSLLKQDRFYLNRDFAQVFLERMILFKASATFRDQAF